MKITVCEEVALTWENPALVLQRGTDRLLGFRARSKGKVCRFFLVCVLPACTYSAVTRSDTRRKKR